MDYELALNHIQMNEMADVKKNWKITKYYKKSPKTAK